VRAQPSTGTYAPIWRAPSVFRRSALRRATDACCRRGCEAQVQKFEEFDMTAIQPWAGSHLTPSLETATVSDAMRVGVMSCEPDAPATAVARMMGTHHIHAVIVEGIHRDPVHGEQLRWGVVSDTDLLRAARSGIESLTAGEIAATEPVTVEPSCALTEAVRLMEEHDTTHLVVADRGRPIGILSTLDVAGVLAWGRA
jgi:CBS domain-containing protein